MRATESLPVYPDLAGRVAVVTAGLGRVLDGTGRGTWAAGASMPPASLSERTLVPPSALIARP